MFLKLKRRFQLTLPCCNTFTFYFLLYIKPLEIRTVSGLSVVRRRFVNHPLT